MPVDEQQKERLNRRLIRAIRDGCVATDAVQPFCSAGVCCDFFARDSENLGRRRWGLLAANGNVVANEAVGHAKRCGLLAWLGVEVIVELALNVECFDRH